MVAMTASIDSRATAGCSHAGQAAGWCPERPAGRALARASRAGFLLGVYLETVGVDYR
jgi:hypothetical protein